MMDHTLVAITKPKVELDSHADTCVVGDNCLSTLDHNRPVMSLVTIQMMATEVPRQLMPQYGTMIHKVDRIISK